MTQAFLKNMAQKTNAEIAQFYAEVMVKDLIKTNEEGFDEFGDFDREDYKTLFTKFAKSLEDYLNA